MTESRNVLSAQLFEKSGLVDRDGGHGGGCEFCCQSGNFSVIKSEAQVGDSDRIKGLPVQDCRKY